MVKLGDKVLVFNKNYYEAITYYDCPSIGSLKEYRIVKNGTKLTVVILEEKGILTEYGWIKKEDVVEYNFLNMIICKDKKRGSLYV